MAQFAPSFGAGPAAVPMPPPIPFPAGGGGDDPFELTKEPSWDAPAHAEAAMEELASTQDMPLDEAAMEMSSADEFEAPAETKIRKSRWDRKNRGWWRRCWRFCLAS